MTLVLDGIPGRFVVIEGLDGAGSTTQAARLCRWLRRRQCRVHLTREPTGGPVGALIRAVLMKRVEVDMRTLAMLFAADRVDHLYCQGTGIVKLLEEGVFVISDRYYLSSYAYQPLESSIDLSWLQQIHVHCVQPDLTIFLDVPVDICLERIKIDRGSHFEIFERKQILMTVKDNYHVVVEKLQTQENIQVVDGNRPPELVEARIRTHVKKFLELRQKGH